MSTPLERLARRVEADPSYLAHILAAYVRVENLDDDGLAAALGLDPSRLATFRLCRAPYLEPDRFANDVRRLAEAFGLDERRLARIVRRGQAAAQGPTVAGDGRGTLSAARDRDTED